MDLLEYQVKEWFGEIGIPVLPSQRIEHPTDLKRLKIPYPVVLKSQVHGDSRLKAGGVRFVETTIDAIAAAQNIFNLSIGGEFPELLLAEAKYNVEQEYYLAVVLDTVVCRPILLGSVQADIDWELDSEKMHHVVVEQEFSPFYARRLALKMGLKGSLMQSISTVIEKMYQLFIEKDLDLVEINPLAINRAGQVMALNGSVRVNDRAIARHPDIAKLATKISRRYSVEAENGNIFDVNGSNVTGKIGILGNGVGSVLTTMDLVVYAGGKPGMCLNLRHASPIDTSPTTFRSRLEKALQILARDRTIKVILINLIGTIPQVSEFVEVIENCYLQQSPTGSTTQGSNRLGVNGDHNGLQVPQLVIRLAGTDFELAKTDLKALQISKNLPITIADNLDTAVTEAVNLTKTQSTVSVGEVVGNRE